MGQSWIRCFWIGHISGWLTSQTTPRWLLQSTKIHPTPSIVRPSGTCQLGYHWEPAKGVCSRFCMEAKTLSSSLSSSSQIPSTSSKISGVWFGTSALYTVTAVLLSSQQNGARAYHRPSELSTLDQPLFNSLSGAANGRLSNCIGLGHVVLSSIFPPRHQCHQQSVATT